MVCQNLDCFLDSVARNRTLAMMTSHLASECNEVEKAFGFVQPGKY